MTSPSGTHPPTDRPRDPRGSDRGDRSDEGHEVTDGRVLRARAQREHRRTQLLAAARRVFAAKGYHGASLQDLLDAGEVSRGTFYQYFDSSRACFAAVLGGFVDTLRAAIRPVVVPSAVPPREQLIANLERVLALLEADAGLTRLLLQEARGADPEFDALLEAFDARILSFILGAFTTGERLGLVRPCDLALRASFVLGALKEAVSQTLLGHEDARPRAVIAAELLDFALYGVLADGLRL